MSSESGSVSRLVEMLSDLFQGDECSRAIVSRVEAEFARCGLDDNPGFADLQHELALFEGREADIRSLSVEAGKCISILRAMEKKAAEPGATDNPDDAQRI